ncbi:MAG: response regulator transcription factor [Piscirickettsiaceae bacterium]|nr:response regulator transcription factor [Piscirickettsiaceae bacterium]
MTGAAKSTLYVVIPEKYLRDSVEAGLPDEYDISFYENLDGYLSAVNQQQPELALCHQRFLEDDQALVLATIKTASPATQILVIGPSRPIETQIAALKHGARGYFDSALTMAKLHIALQSVLHGEVWVERHVISGLIDELTHVPEVTEQQRLAVESLSPKELEVSELVSHGATNKMIADKMSITERTVKAHLTTVFQKMNVADRLSLAIFFRDLR